MNLKTELCRAPLSSDFKSEFYYLRKYIVFVPTFEENEIFVLGVVFFMFSQLSSIEIIVFNQKFLYPMKISTS